jgi:cyanophycin synthetase
MRILQTQTLRGPNYWSIRRNKLIVMQLALEELTEKTSNEIPGFYEGVIQVLPSLIEHHCSRGHRGGFLERIKEGTLMGHIVEHIALELQELAGMPVGFGRTRETSTPGVFNVAFEYVEEQAGRYAGRAAVRLCQSIVETGTYSSVELEKDLRDLQELHASTALGPSTETIIKEAEARKIPWMWLSARAMLQLGYGAKQKRIQATLSNNTSILAVELACDKEGTKNILGNAGVPVPKGTVIEYLDELEQAIADVGGYPIVIKPLDGNHGRGITININDVEEAELAYDLASRASKTRSVIVEQYYQGNDHRVLVINGKVVAVAERVPAHVRGNGKDTIRQLIELTNEDPRRGNGHDNVLTKIVVDQTSLTVLQKQGYDLDSILPFQEIAYLRATANLSTGGVAIDRTDEIHPHNIWLAQRVAKIIGLDIAGIDIVTSDISKPLDETKGVIVEVNAAPGFRMHAAPSYGLPRNVGASVLEMLFPEQTPSRIPIVAITGTNGKTTTTRLTAHIYRQTDKVVGFTATDGIYIQEYLVEQGDNTGPYSAGMILRDPTVEVAVLETARGGILRSGLAFDSCDIGVVLNVAADHLGLGGIDTIEQMARVKAVVAEAVKADGYAILNADDPLVAAMAEKLNCNVAYFSMNPDNPIIMEHSRRNGLAAVYEHGYLAILEGKWTLRIEKAINIPMTMGGKAPFMIANALASCLAAFAQGVDIELIDYAHNPHGFKAVGDFVRNWQGNKIAVVGGPGDRRDEDLILLGNISAQIFDQILIKEDQDPRGRKLGEVAEIIQKGVYQIGADKTHEIILDETEAINKALNQAQKGSLVVIFPEKIASAINLVKQRIHK